MPIKILCISLALFSVSIYCQSVWIGWMRRLNLGQAIKSYGPRGHLKKIGTPSMGGMVALLMALFLIAMSYCFGAAKLTGMVAVWSYPILASLVGLTDDMLKLMGKSSEGLSSLQKLIFQIAVTIPWAVWAAKGGVHLSPSIEIGPAYGVPLLAFLGVGILNAVNVTDGLDGLAGGALTISFAALLMISRTPSVTLSAAAGLAVLAAFLWHNSNPADLFMGDVGAHLWAGLLLTLCIESKFLLLIFPAGFLFGVEIAAVAIQIVALRWFGRKVFRMSPLHHHFELCGWEEPKIVWRFCVAHLVGMAALLIFALTLYGGSVSNVRQ
jgi:phospho-N-acetylmuramoyl-pentapeptide-transferase